MLSNVYLNILKLFNGFEIFNCYKFISNIQTLSNHFPDETFSLDQVVTESLEKLKSLKLITVENTSDNSQQKNGELFQCTIEL